MKLLLVTLTILFVVLDTLDVSQACSSCHNTSHHYKRRKRDVPSESTLKALKILLQTFDEELIETLKPDLEYLTPEERSKFDSDLEGVNIAVEVELTSVLSELGEKATPKKLVQEVVTRIMDDFGEKVWLKRIQAFAGKKLDNLTQEFINRADTVTA